MRIRIRNHLLKDLFSKGIENERGEAISNRVIQKRSEDVVKSENKQKLYDQQLVVVLAQKGLTSPAERSEIP